MRRGHYPCRLFRRGKDHRSENWGAFHPCSSLYVLALGDVQVMSQDDDDDDDDDDGDVDVVDDDGTVSFSYSS